MNQATASMPGQLGNALVYELDTKIYGDAALGARACAVHHHFAARRSPLIPRCAPPTCNVQRLHHITCNLQRTQASRCG